MKRSKTNRGFTTIEFTDTYGAKCSLQKSSLATGDRIWLGVDDPDPKIMCSDARKHGLEPPEEVGWMKYPIPPEVLINTRMHLDREQVKELIHCLQVFVDTGEL